MLVTSVLFSKLVLLTAITSAAPAPKNIWAISVFRDPAPSPEDGPPASAHALRDPSKLKFEIVGIVFAYIFWILATIVAITLIGRRVRKRQEQEQRHSRAMEMFKSGRVTLREIDAGPKSPLGPLSPKSPGKMSSIRSWTRGNKSRGMSDVSVNTTASKVDERVIEHDKAKNMDEMANLYAAVMIHDEVRSSKKSHSSADSSPVLDDNTPATPRSPRTPRTPRSPQYPPEFAHPAYVPPVPQSYAQSYPIVYQEQAQPIYEAMPQSIPETDEESLLEGQTPRKPKKSLSIVSAATSRLGSSHSGKAKPAPITVRGQPISKPLGSADLRQSAYNTSQNSLPSVYSPGPPPPTPGKFAQAEEIEMHGVPQMTAPSQTSLNSGSKALPFRQFYQSDALKSAPATKTTFLDRRASAFNGPKTGVPKTPYSPYCPQTPMTPITPRRLLNKEELKKNKKQYALAKVEENSMVKNDDDMWGT